MGMGPSRYPCVVPRLGARRLPVAASTARRVNIAGSRSAVDLGSPTRFSFVFRFMANNHRFGEGRPVLTTPRRPAPSAVRFSAPVLVR